MIRRLLCHFAWLGLAAISGCGEADYDTIPTHPVTGQITVNGAPAKGAIVRFTPKTPQPGSKYPLLPSGKANEEGVYQLTTYEGADGAPVGDYIITVEWPDPAWRPPGGGLPPPPPDRLMGRFADPKASQLSATVVEGENQVATIALENVPILKGSSLN